uniref:Uncharacterized protein n=1 Tax=Human herpesvirus 1 TaxID=10298 RepID=A0A2Z4GZT2_HHV1|nr:hypothetical protein [Human alphaherpesvirus 1]
MPARAAVIITTPSAEAARNPGAIAATGCVSKASK